VIQFIGTEITLRVLLKAGDYGVISWVMPLPVFPDMPVETADSARAFIDSREDWGREIKGFLQAGLSAVPTPRFLPTAWMDLWGGAEVPAGVLDPDRPAVLCINGFHSACFGVQAGSVHEYFLNGLGTLVLESDGQGFDGDVSWTAKLSESRVPLVLSDAFVSAGWMPPGGQSALPERLAEVVPSEYRYWEQVDQVGAARATRDALAASGFFAEENISIVDGDLRRLVLKRALYQAGDPWEAGYTAPARQVGPVAKHGVQVPVCKFSLLHQTPRGQGGHSADPVDERFYFVIDSAVGPDVWVASCDFRKADGVGWKIAEAPDGILEFSGVWGPGEGLNDGADTAANVVIVDQGTVLKEAPGTFLLRGKSGRSRVRIAEAASHTDVWHFGPDAHDVALRDVVEKRLHLVHKKADEQYVLGIVLEPNDGQDGAPLDPDSHNDIYSAEDIKNAAHLWLAEYQHLGVMHAFDAADAIQVVESYLAPADFELDGVQVRKGTWLMGLKILDLGLWADIKNGSLTGLSMGGSAAVEPA